MCKVYRGLGLVIPDLERVIISWVFGTVDSGRGWLGASGCIRGRLGGSMSVGSADGGRHRWGWKWFLHQGNYTVRRKVSSSKITW